ncbi:MAG TPA: hypothetical protein VMS00_06340 [Acidimicrobiales bacterium]|nr:hypothetical protein [Acidimicrobiales bacterium]
MSGEACVRETSFVPIGELVSGCALSLRPPSHMLPPYILQLMERIAPFEDWD